MRRPTALVATAALAGAVALALPAGAAAKGVVSLRVCGEGACHGVDRAAVRAGIDGAVPAPAPRRGEPYYTVRARARVSDARVETWTIDYLPRARMIRGADGSGGYVWSRPEPVLERALRRAARGLRPHAASALGALESPEPRARVVEVFAPARDAGDGGSLATAAVAGAALVAALGAAGALRARRRRRPNANPPR
jgi:hypothetical protein